MCTEVFQYRALFEYKKERENDINLLPGDMLTVNKSVLLTTNYQEGDEKTPKGWLNGVNERNKDKGDFPGTYVEFVGPIRFVPPTSKPRPRPVPPTPDSSGAASPAPHSGTCPSIKKKLAPFSVVKEVIGRTRLVSMHGNDKAGWVDFCYSR